ncbi:MAG: membrane-associated oxidoreductase [Nitrosomonadales bacterium]|nr:membrane-associated oxidoreductase [Nitrosomonadales bacterium]
MVEPVNGVSLASSHVGRLADDAGSWGKWLHLDGFTYDSIASGAPTDAVTRLAWLDKQYQPHSGLNGNGADFKPQPWRQLAKVLREMGHAENARQVAIAFEHRLRKANLIGQMPKHWGKLNSWFYRNISRGGHWLFWVFTGYGYRPLRLLAWIFGVWMFCGMLYWYVALAGVFAPSNPLVFQNLAYDVCKPGHVTPAQQGKAASAAPPTIQGAGNWYLCEKLPEEYSGFSPLAYSLDVILPLVDLQQETSWSPLIQTPKNVWYQELAAFDLKHLTRLVLWFEILFGWVSSLLLVAVVSGLTKRREE